MYTAYHKRLLIRVLCSNCARGMSSLKTSSLSLASQTQFGGLAYETNIIYAKTQPTSIKERLIRIPIVRTCYKVTRQSQSKGVCVARWRLSHPEPGTERNNGGTFRPVPPTKIRNCAWIKAHKTKTVITKFLLASWF